MEIRKPYTSFFIIFLFCLLTQIVSAQNANDKAKKAERGSVTVTQSAEIDAIVNRPRQGNTQSTQEKKVQKQPDNTVGSTVASQSAETSTTTGNATLNTEVAEGEEVQVVRPARPKDDDLIRMHDVDYTSVDPVQGPKIMRGSRQVRGYQIQVYTGANKGIDRRNANEAGSKIKSKYPSLPVYVHFYSPRWVCRCGNFHKYKEAEDFLKKLRLMGFPRASIVRATIMVNDNDKTYLANKNKNNEEE